MFKLIFGLLVKVDFSKLVQFTCNVCSEKSKWCKFMIPVLLSLLVWLYLVTSISVSA